ncbi:MAG TPA: isoprenyl transferase [Phycisphaerales bacterium]|nr:isoprenyl transferase [Phycisphaerales bacterium]
MMQETTEINDATARLLEEIPAGRRPRHVAIIMDGNGRWALARKLPRIAGHRAGARTVRGIVIESGKIGIEALTLYSFSLENWKRPEEEVGGLMSLYLEYLAKERQELLDNNVRLVQIGRREGLPSDVLSAVDETVAATAHCTGLKLVLALNYGSRAEITDAVRAIARKVKSGTLDASQISERTVSEHLYTRDLPDPDLLIRTAGERRVSNYLLWQISYAEIHVTDVFWPEFTAAHLHAAIRDYASRNRRFGALDETNS